MSYQYVREPLTAEQADQLYQACHTMKEKLVIWTLLETGLRISELCNLTKDSILWQQKALSINGKGGPYGKMSKKRMVPMSLKVQKLFSEHFTVNDKFPLKKRHAQHTVKVVADRTSIFQPVSAHVLRHTFATLALQKNVCLATVQKILGHDRLATTQIYLNFTNEHISDEFARKW